MRSRVLVHVLSIRPPPPWYVPRETQLHIVEGGVRERTILNTVNPCRCYRRRNSSANCCHVSERPSASFTIMAERCAGTASTIAAHSSGAIACSVTNRSSSLPRSECLMVGSAASALMTVSGILAPTRLGFTVLYRSEIADDAGETVVSPNSSSSPSIADSQIVTASHAPAASPPTLRDARMSPALATTVRFRLSGESLRGSTELWGGVEPS